MKVGDKVLYFTSAKVPQGVGATIEKVQGSLYNVRVSRSEVHNSVPLCDFGASSPFGGDYITPTQAASGPTPPPKPDPTPPKDLVMLTDFGPSGQGTTFEGVLGKTYCWPCPPDLGILSSTGVPGTPLELTLEWAVSKTPGDFTYYKSDAACVKTPPRNTPTYPCGAAGGVESGGVNCGPQGCVISPGMFLNLRFTSGIPANTPTKITYSWSPKAA